MSLPREPTGLDPRIARLVAWTKIKDDDALPYLGALVDLQNKSFVVGLYVRRVRTEESLEEDFSDSKEGRDSTVLFSKIGFLI